MTELIKKWLILQRMSNIYVRRGMIVDKVHEMISFGDSNWVEKYIGFITRKK